MLAARSLAMIQGSALGVRAMAAAATQVRWANGSWDGAGWAVGTAGDAHRTCDPHRIKCSSTK